MADLARELKKGMIDVIILKLIEKKDMYGYEVIQAMEKKTKGYFKLKEGSLYSILYGLEDKGLIKSYWNSEISETTPKKYYGITDEGKDTLDETLREWILFLIGTNKVLLNNHSNKEEKS